MKGRTEADAPGNFFERGIAGGEEAAGLSKSKMKHILPWRISRNHFNFPADLRIGRSEPPRKLGDTHRLREVSGKMLLGFGDNSRNSSLPLRRNSCMVPRGEHGRTSYRQFGIETRARLARSCMHGLDAHLKIRRHRDAQHRCLAEKIFCLKSRFTVSPRNSTQLSTQPVAGSGR